jgi:hypothetical protein
MGCGHNRRPGYVNVDASSACGPDEVVNLEATPWPWPDNCAEEVLFIHSLEHMGAEAGVFLALLTELYRVCAPDASVVIHVPHPRHDSFINDPTHVRVITPTVLGLFDRELNARWVEIGAANTTLAFYTGVDFKVESSQAVLAEPYRSQFESGQASQASLTEAVRSLNNVVEEWRIVMRVRKPQPGADRASAD